MHDAPYLDYKLIYYLFQRLMKYFSDKKNGIVNTSDDEKDVSDDEMADT